MIVTAAKRNRDEPTLMPIFGERAWDECAELQVQDKYVWLSKLINSLMNYERYEITVADKGKYLGGCILLHEYADPHVGECMTLLTQYVLPEFRHLGVSRILMRHARRKTKEENCKVLAYSHRIRPFVYETIYKVVHEERT